MGTAEPSTHESFQAVIASPLTGGLDVFYREARPKDAPAVPLLQGFPTSSQMFRNLIPPLADGYRVVAPDYPYP